MGSSFPRREALLQRVHRDYSDLELSVVPRGKPVDLLPADSLSMTLHGRVTRLTDAQLLEMAGALREADAYVTARWSRSVAGMRAARLVAAPQPVGEVGGGAVTNLTLVLDGQFRADFDPIAGIRRRGLALMEWAGEPNDVWLALPRAWR